MTAADARTRNGTSVAAICFATLAAFFVYQWWFNPTRAVQRRLNDIAATLSAPNNEPPTARMTRVGRLRRFLAEDISVRAGASELTSRDRVLSVVSAAAPPPGGWNIQFVDVQVRVNHNTGVDAGAFMTIEVNGRDPSTGQPTVDTREAAVTMKKLNGEWVVATVDTKEPLSR